jgi:hypothetical protein
MREPAPQTGTVFVSHAPTASLTAHEDELRLDCPDHGKQRRVLYHAAMSVTLEWAPNRNADTVEPWVSMLRHLVHPSGMTHVRPGRSYRRLARPRPSSSPAKQADTRALPTRGPAATPPTRSLRCGVPNGTGLRSGTRSLQLGPYPRRVTNPAAASRNTPGSSRTVDATSRQRVVRP